MKHIQTILFWILIANAIAMSLINWHQSYLISQANIAYKQLFDNTKTLLDIEQHLASEKYYGEH